MNSASFEQLVADLLTKLKSDLRSSSEISRLSGISQPTVSRFRSGKASRKRSSGPFIKLCNFYGILKQIELKENSRNNQVLLDAITAVWDGTEAHAQALARVIHSLKGLRITQPRDIEVNGGQDAGL